MKKATKILGIMLVAMMLVMIMMPMCAATDGVTVKPGEIADLLTGTKSEAQNQVVDIGNQIIGIITTVGVVVSVIILLVLGIKYMMGSASEKAEYKKTMIPYLVGAVLIFGASAITTVVVQLASLGGTEG